MWHLCYILRHLSLFALLWKPDEVSLEVERQNNAAGYTQWGMTYEGTVWGGWEPWMKTNERSVPQFPTEDETRILTLLCPNTFGQIYHLCPKVCEIYAYKTHWGGSGGYRKPGHLSYIPYSLSNIIQVWKSFKLPWKDAIYTLLMLLAQ